MLDTSCLDCPEVYLVLHVGEEGESSGVVILEVVQVVLSNIDQSYKWYFTTNITELLIINNQLRDVSPYKLELLQVLIPEEYYIPTTKTSRSSRNLVYI